MSDEAIDNKTLEYIRELAIQLQKDPSQRGRVMKVLAGQSSVDISRLLATRRHNMPYYKEHFALELKYVLDRMMQSKKAQKFNYADFPRLSKHSLYLKVYQSFLWLVDHADPTGEYIKLRNDTEISHNNGGVIIAYVNRDLAPLSRAEEFDDTVVELPAWRKEINVFIETGLVGEKLIKDKLSLTEEEANSLREELSGIEGLLCKVETHRILLVKPRPEDLAALNK